MFSFLASIMLIFTIIIGVLTMLAIITNNASSTSESILHIVATGCLFLFVIFLLWCIGFSDALITNHPLEILPA
mgnify:CR=1 FL=1